MFARTSTFDGVNDEFVCGVLSKVRPACSRRLNAANHALCIEILGELGELTPGFCKTCSYLSNLPLWVELRSMLLLRLVLLRRRKGLRNESILFYRMRIDRNFGSFHGRVWWRAKVRLIFNELRQRAKEEKKGGALS